MSCALTAGYALGCRESVGGVRDIRIAKFNPVAGFTISSGTVRWFYGYGLENLILQSQTLDVSGSWSRNNFGSINANNAFAPDNIQTADRLTFSSNPNGSWLAQPVTIDSGVTYTFSCFVKNSTFSNPAQHFAMFAYKDGSVATQLNIYPSGHAGTNLYYGVASAYTGVPTYKQEDYGNGWYRYSMTFTPSASYPLGTTNFQFYASQASLGNSSRACFIWGVQLERSDYAGYYVPTVAASSYVGYPFYRYELPKQTATMNEAEIVSPENGTLYYQQDLTLIENKLNIVLRNEFHNMAQIKTIAIVNDRNGAKWMLGSDTGLEVTEGMAQTGVQQTDRTGYEITLTGLESYPMLAMSDALSTASAGGYEGPVADGSGQQQSGSGSVNENPFPELPQE